MKQATLLFSIFGSIMLGHARVSPCWAPYLSGSTEQRVFLVKSLATMHSHEAITLLVGALADPKGDVVGPARDALRAKRSSEVFQSIVAGMPTGSQWQAAHLLADYREPRYIKAMNKLLRHDKTEVRGPIALALGIIHDNQSFGPLLKATHDPNPNVRDEAARALNCYDDPAHQTIIRKLLEKPNGA